MFETLKHLPRPLRFSFSCSVSEESNLALNVTDSKTNECAKIILDEKSFSERLQLGDISKCKWRQNMPLILDVFECIYRKLEAAIKLAEGLKDRFSVKQFVTEDKILAVAGKITKMLLLGRTRHLKAEDSGLPVGIYVFAKNVLGDCLVFLNLKGAEFLGKGASRQVKPCIEIINTLLCAKGTWKGADKEAIARESDALMSLRNTPGVIHTYATTVKLGGSYVVFQECFPTNLRDALVNENFHFSESNKQKIIEQVLEGVVGIHPLGTHCDLQLRNIVINDQMKTAIIDFGAFHPLGVSSLFFFGDLFPPPEWTENIPLSPAFDIWQLGNTFYSLYTGELPREPDLKGVDLWKWISELKSGWLKIGKEIPPKVAELITNMTEPDPKKRFTAQQALDFIRGSNSSKNLLSEEKKE
jgi:serine/threonine protein kinase